MHVEAAVDHFRTSHRAVLIARKRNGSPQPSPVAVGVDETGRLTVSSRETAFKVRNLRRDPRVWLCGFRDEWYGPWVQVEGLAEVVSLPDAMGPLVDYYRSVAGEHPDWDEYRAAMTTEQRCLLVIEPTVAGPDRQG
ncbi:MAG TPA: PPOX class F420-dependent oxidoreductase [Acidimicrobiales bacterium]|nr:PPOX class F420-dependent oxidoreductase [Acidimicrobiales bacterium]